MIFIIIIHVIVCFGLIILVLIQRGRGSGLVESFHGVESMFGTKTSAFLTRTTTILSILFFITCLSLAILSVRQSRSLIRDTRGKTKGTQTAESKEPIKQATQEAPKAEGASISEQRPQENTQIPSKESVGQDTPKLEEEGINP